MNEPVIARQEQPETGSVRVKPRRPRPVKPFRQTGFLAGSRFVPLRRAINILITLYFLFAGYQALTGNMVGAVCGTLVILCAILPGLLWVTGRAKGYPILPLFSGCYAYAYGAQFLTNRSILNAATTTNLAYACLVICSFLLVTCGVWFYLVKTPTKLPTRALTLGGPGAPQFLLVLFFCYTAYEVANAAQWLGFLGSLLTMVRAVIYSFGALSTFALAYMLGEGRLSNAHKQIFIVLFALAVMASASSLILIHSLSLWFLSVAGFVLGSGRVPWKAVLIAVPFIIVLQSGKYALRSQNWETPENRFGFAIKPWEYPSFYAKWAALSVAVGDGKRNVLDERPGLLERSSLLHMFLTLDNMSPKYVPFMNGETYKSVLSAILPRFLFPNKISALESTNLISIHYGLQTRDATSITTIGWGLLNEAYANFAFPGVIGLAVLLGWLFGWVTQFSMGYPLLSARGLFAVIVMNGAFQTEYTSGTFVSSIFQAAMALMVLTLTIMREQPVPKPKVAMTVDEFVDKVVPKRLIRPQQTKSRPA